MNDKRKILSLLTAGAALFSCAFIFGACSGETEGKNEEKNAYTRCDVNGEENAEGKYIKFGSYPQTETIDGDMVSALNKAAGDLPTDENSANWTSYGYYIENDASKDFMWYIDVEYNDEKYRGVYFTNYRPYWTEFPSDEGFTYQYANGYRTYVVYWFKYEPIIWQILSEDEESGSAFVVSETVIDARHFYRETTSSASSRSAIERYDDEYYAGKGETTTKSVYANDYKFSDIRAWLNENFYLTAFNSSEQSIIRTTEVSNDLASTVDYDGMLEELTDSSRENSTDKVFLLSEYEITDPQYGFASYITHDEKRRKKPSDYAEAQGVYSYNEDFYNYQIENIDGCAIWALRSPYNGYSDDANYGLCIEYTGLAYYTNNVNNTASGVLPAMNVSLK